MAPFGFFAVVRKWLQHKFGNRRFLRVPLTSVRTKRLPVRKVRGTLPLWIANARGQVEAVLFRVDSGATISTMPLEVAQDHQLPIPPESAEVEISLATATRSQSVRVRCGEIRVWLTEQGQGEPFNWPILFLVGVPYNTPALLGLSPVLQDLRWIFDGTPQIGAPFGTLTLEDIRNS